VTNKLLSQGSKLNGLYKLENPQFLAYYSSRQQSTSDVIWHRRLGHPHHQVMQHLSTISAISYNKTTKSMCEACQLGKTCRLPFSRSEFQASKPLERIHCDVWGPVPVTSVQETYRHLLTPSTTPLLQAWYSGNKEPVSTTTSEDSVEELSVQASQHEPERTTVASESVIPQVSESPTNSPQQSEQPTSSASDSHLSENVQEEPVGNTHRMVTRAKQGIHKPNPSTGDPFLFIYQEQQSVMLLLMYVDDMVLTGNDSSLISKLLSKLNEKFMMKDMGPLKYFLGIQAQFTSKGLFLNQEKYATDLLINAGMLGCAPMPTPLPVQIDRMPHQDELFQEPTYFRSLAESVARSSTEAEYRTLSDTAVEMSWITAVLKQIGLPQEKTPDVYCDNLATMFLSANPVLHTRSKHFATHFHFAREMVAMGTLVGKHIPAHLQIADIFTKPLPQASFLSLRFKLGVDYPPTSSLRGDVKTSSPVQNREAHQEPKLQSKASPTVTMKTNSHHHRGKSTAPTAHQIQLNNRFASLSDPVLSDSSS
ncbi:unnamed protein product, partial [Arabidopsis halleri]